MAFVTPLLAAPRTARSPSRSLSARASPFAASAPRRAALRQPRRAPPRMSQQERTFVAVKPDGMNRGLLGDIISRFEAKGYKLVAIKTLVPSRDLAQTHYAALSEKPFFPKLVDFITSGPVCAMVWEGTGVVATARRMIGETNPLASNPGTIRGDFGVDVGRKCVAAVSLLFRCCLLVSLHIADHLIRSCTRALLTVCARPASTSASLFAVLSVIQYVLPFSFRNSSWLPIFPPTLSNPFTSSHPVPVSYLLGPIVGLMLSRRQTVRSAYGFLSRSCANGSQPLKSGSTSNASHSTYSASVKRYYTHSKRCSQLATA